MENFVKNSPTSKSGTKPKKGNDGKKEATDTSSGNSVSNSSTRPIKKQEKNAEPVNGNPDIDLGPGSSKTVMPRCLGAKPKTRHLPKVPKAMLKESVQVDLPILNTDPLNDMWDMRPNSPNNQPSSPEILENYKAMKNWSVPPSEAEWPLGCIFGEDCSTFKTPNRVKTPKPTKSPLQGFEKDLNFEIDAMLHWEKYGRKYIRQEEGNINRNRENYYTRTIGPEEEQAMNDWIESEGLREPMKDMEDFDILLGLAMDYDKNKDLLFKILKPQSPVGMPVKDPKKCLPSKSSQLKKPSGVMLKPDKDIEKKQPISETIKKDEQVTDPGPSSSGIKKERVNGPLAPIDQDAIDFANEIDKQLMIPKSPGETTITLSTASGWKSSFTVRLEDSKEVADENIKKNGDNHAENPCSTNELLMRTLELPPVLSKMDWIRQKIPIIRRPAKPKFVVVNLDIEFKVCKPFCTLNLKKNLDLKKTSNTIQYAVYNSAVDVIQIQYTALTFGWVWSDGTLMIINGFNETMLAKTQSYLAGEITGNKNFTADASHGMIMLYVITQCYDTMMPFVYFVHKDLPGVVARINQTGMIEVFAMITAHADEMLKKLYLMTVHSKHNHDSM